MTLSDARGSTCHICFCTLDVSRTCASCDSLPLIFRGSVKLGIFEL